MDLQLRNKIAFVTGASSGIGAATALLLAEEGAHVVIGYRHHEAAARLVLDQVQSQGVQGWLCKMDVADAENVQAGFRQVHSDTGGLDLLIHCAGENRIQALEDLPPSQWTEVIAINLNGAFHVLQAGTPLLRDGAGVVLVSSVAGDTGAPRHAHYAAAKAGVINLTKSAARSLAPRIRVNCVAPGVTNTEMGRATMEGAGVDYARKKLLLQRFAEPIEIARCIVFAASPANSFMTGATLDVNGGRTLR